MDMLIRNYSDSDFLFVKEILVEAFPEVKDFLLKSLVDSSSLNIDKSKYIQLVAEQDGNIMGYALVSRCFDPVLHKVNFWIDYVCVSEIFRGKGIGKQLLQKIEEFAINEDVMFLQLTSSRFRTNARKLYMYMGYEIRESDIFRKVLK